MFVEEKTFRMVLVFRTILTKKKKKKKKVHRILHGEKESISLLQQHLVLQDR